jgi:hypothetical protein
VINIILLDMIAHQLFIDVVDLTLNYFYHCMASLIGEALMRYSKY